MAGGLSNTEQRVLAQVLVCGDVDKDTLYNVSPMLSESQKKALDSLAEEGLLEHTLYEHH
jgi:hypothetical protein